MEKWLIIGSGGREYAFAKSLARHNDRLILVAPGNPMMNNLQNVSTVSISETDVSALATFARENDVTCTLVGPEVPLSKGIVDEFNLQSLPIFGPTQSAARLESSKDFAKSIMQRAGVKTAKHQTFTKVEEAKDYIASRSLPIVIKADGLASGKGVIIAQTQDEADQAIAELLTNGHHSSILVEDFLEGEEFSLFVMANGEQFMAMPPSQDHKRLLDNDEGPNTGGMGAYSPVPQISQSIQDTAINEVVKPVLRQMVKEGHSFTGFLYAGLILTKEGIQVIEFNVRMGDPETQVVLPQLESDLGDAIVQLLAGKTSQLTWQQGQYYIGNVVASMGYPKKVLDSQPLPVFNDTIDVDYAGVKEINNQFVSSGGRVLMAIAHDQDLAKAQTKLNDALAPSVNKAHYHYRTDIGSKGIKFLSAEKV
ncbi:phosphoribosylamine--glycine ligase [Holzapfeliella sp. JNUCC 72]